MSQNDYTVSQISSMEIENSTMFAHRKGENSPFRGKKGKQLAVSVRKLNGIWGKR